MYIEYKVIDGKVYVRHDPHEEFTKLATLEEVTDLYIQESYIVGQLRDEVDKLSKAMIYATSKADD